MLECRSITRSFSAQGAPVLHNVNLTFHPGTLTCVLGKSGCGKSTLLNILGGIDTGFSGQLLFDGVSISADDPETLDAYRRNVISFVFQEPHLIGYLTAQQNVQLGLDVTGSATQSEQSAIKELGLVGLQDKLSAFPDELSGGQAQRVSVARALVGQPQVILADEPTGSLDAAAAQGIMQLLKEAAGRGITVVVVTHDETLARKYADEVVCLDSEGSVDLPRQTKDVPPAQSMAARAWQVIHQSHLKQLIAAHVKVVRGQFIKTCAIGTVGVFCLALVCSLLFGLGSYYQSFQDWFALNNPLLITLDTQTVGTPVVQSAQSASASELMPDATFARAYEKMMEESSQEVNTTAALNAFKTNLFTNTALTSRTYGISYRYPLSFYAYTAEETPTCIYTGQTYGDMVSTVLAGTSVEYGGESSEALNQTFWRQIVLPTETDQTDDDSPYQLLTGRFPQAADEVVLITAADGTITDFALTQLGLADWDDLPITSPVSYDTLLSLEYYVVMPADLYKRTSGGLWEMSALESSSAAITAKNCLKVRVVGIVAPPSTGADSYEYGGIGYGSDLVDYLREHAAETPVVKAQKADTKRNVITGETFGSNTTQAGNILDGVDTSVFSAEKVELFKSLSDYQVARLKSLIPQYFDGDHVVLTDALIETINNLSVEDLQRMIERYIPAETSTSAQDALEALGALDTSSFNQIAVYARGFSDRSAIMELVDAYNESLGSDQLGLYISISDPSEAVVNQVQKMFLAALIAMIVVGVICLLLMSVLVWSTTAVSVARRSQELGVLRSLGATARDITQIFTGEALVSGAYACVIGMVLFLCVAPMLSYLVRQLTGIADLVAVNLWLCLCVIALTLILTYVASCLPARKNAFRNAAEVLKKER